MKRAPSSPLSRLMVFASLLVASFSLHPALEASDPRFPEGRFFVGTRDPQVDIIGLREVDLKGVTSTFSNTSGSVPGSVTTQDDAGRRTTLDFSKITVDKRGRALGVTGYEIKDADGNTLIQVDVPTRGKTRVGLQQRYRVELNQSPSLESEKGSIGLSLGGSVKVPSPFLNYQYDSFSYNLRGNARHTDGETKEGILWPGIRVQVRTGHDVNGLAPDRGRGLSTVDIERVEVATGSLAITGQNYDFVNGSTNRFAGDAPFVLWPGQEVTPGGVSRLNIRYRDEERDKPGRYQVNQMNDVFRARENGYFLFTEAEAEALFYNPEAMNLLPQASSFSTPSARTTLGVRWDF